MNSIQFLSAQTTDVVLRRVARSAIGLALLALFPAMGADSIRVGSFDFDYAAAGDVRAKPVQVFDNGRETYFQFRAGEAVPAIFSNKSNVPQLLQVTQEGPYVKVPEVHGRFVLQVGRAQANVVYSGPPRESSPPINLVAPSGATAPFNGGSIPEGARMVATLSVPGAGGAPDTAIYRNSYATPIKGDAVTWGETTKSESVVWFARGSAALSPEARRELVSIARSIGDSSRAIVTGRDDDTLKEGLDRARADAIVEALRKLGVDPSRVSVRSGVAGTPNGKQWPSSITVETVRQVAQPRANVRANLDALVQAGVLNPEQASAIASQQSSRGANDAARPIAYTLAAADRTIQGSLRRWASQTNYQLVWDAPAALDAQITGDAVIGGATIQEALERLLNGLKERGYVLDATVYSNRVIRIAVPGATPQRPAIEAPSSPEPIRPQPTQRPRSASAQTAAQWQMRQGDANVQNMLARWADDAQWRLVWNASDRVPITGDAVVNEPTFKAAAEAVIAQASAVGYRLRASATNDRTLVVSSY
jgi:hypothetical protein